MPDMESLNSIIQMHIKECDGRDERNTKAVDRIETMFKGIWDSQDKMADKITELQVRGAIAIGGIIVLGKLMDYYLAWGHK